MVMYLHYYPDAHCQEASPSIYGDFHPPTELIIQWADGTFFYIFMILSKQEEKKNVKMAGGEAKGKGIGKWFHFNKERKGNKRKGLN